MLLHFTFTDQWHCNYTDQFNPSIPVDLNGYTRLAKLLFSLKLIVICMQEEMNLLFIKIATSDIPVFMRLLSAAYVDASA